MTLTELKKISESCQTDAEFLAHLDVRRVYWKAIGVTAWSHITMSCGMGDTSPCVKCHREIQDETCTPFECDVPDHIPGSLADAAEALRVKVAEKWCADGDFQERYAEAYDGMHTFDMIEIRVLDTPRDHFIDFAAALGAVEEAT